MNDKLKKALIVLGPVLLQDWIVQASMFDNHILVYMFNEVNGKFHMQCVNSDYEANLFIEYVIEKNGEI
jgi:hypothetical protein